MDEILLLVATSRSVDWNLVVQSIAAGGSIFVGIVAVLAGFGVFQIHRRPKLKLSFQEMEPWCRTTEVEPGRRAYWIRLVVENARGEPAEGLIAKAMEVRTGGALRADLDPMRLRWATAEGPEGFRPISLRNGEHEFLNLFEIVELESLAKFVTGDEERRRGVETFLRPDATHEVRVTVFADNADPVSATMRMEVGDAFDAPTLTFTHEKGHATSIESLIDNPEI